jgi:tRNA_anti-like
MRSARQSFRVAMTISTALVGASGCSKPSAGGADAAQGETIVVGASDLAAAYKADRARADAEYKGRRVRVSGVVGEVRKEPEVSISLGREGDPNFAECHFAEAFAKNAAFLTKGMRLTIECDCDGLATTVVLRRCALPAGAPSPSGSASAGARAIDVCKKLEAGGVAASCRAGEGTGDSARFDIVSMQGKSGLVVRFNDDGTYAKYVAGVAAQPATSPLRPYHGSPASRVVVHLTPGVAQEIEDKMKSVVDGL